MPAVDADELRSWALAAGAGDTGALGAVVAAVRDDVYRLALRMLWHPTDAEDACQEALVRIVTRIASYRGEAAFRTWAYRVAANHIRNWQLSPIERENLDFHRFAEPLHDGLASPIAAPTPYSPRRSSLAARSGCCSASTATNASPTSSSTSLGCRATTPPTSPTPHPNAAQASQPSSAATARVRR
jgi:Sigma-70 region 2